MFSRTTQFCEACSTGRAEGKIVDSYHEGQISAWARGTFGCRCLWLSPYVRWQFANLAHGQGRSLPCCFSSQHAWTNGRRHWWGQSRPGTSPDIKVSSKVAPLQGCSAYGVQREAPGPEERLDAFWCCPGARKRHCCDDHGWRDARDTAAPEVIFAARRRLGPTGTWRCGVIYLAPRIEVSDPLT